MLSWLRPRDATIPELEAQLAAAKAELSEAESATAAAVQAFDDDPSAGAKPLSKARERESLAAEHVGRAERLLQAARAKVEADARKRDEARLAELERLVSHAAAEKRRAPSFDRLVGLLEEAARVQVERAAVESELANLEMERRSLEQRLFGVEPPLSPPRASLYVHTVVEFLEGRASACHGTPLADALRGIADGWGRP